MLCVTTPDVAHRPIREVLGTVSGSVVQSKHVGRDIMAGFKSIFGGEIRGYTQMLVEAREEAMHRAIAEAEHMGADAIVNLRFTTSTIMQGASEILVYGTAVKLS
ncbi:MULTISPECIES: YbjQ family protein [unclassified Photobacterium]|uniref:YbjQ family protein n=1 Tax=unclassified Photobacterium TaxID=2628852 RepID=UPI001B8CCC49|nr:MULTISPECIES: heavy metal-binding domain-containing protein [unclassified Photobacterium]MDO6707245.1 heavy metal-binding domain-containing protein [Photobacterium sp. 1_MG-2023]QUJ69891.1 heavy metal-binding domain-containing protein [Photobacterium sp. GJ3]